MTTIDRAPSAAGLADRLAARRDALRRSLADQGLAGAMLTNPASRQYLAGFRGDDTVPVTLAVVLVGPDTQRLMTTATNTGWAEAESPGTDIVAWVRPWEPPVAEAILQLGWKRVGFEAHAISHASFRALSETLGGSVELVDIGATVDRLRAVKEPDEIAAIRAAIALTDETFVRATAGLTAGTTERELAWAIERTMRELGAEGPAFATIVAAGPHAARPHHVPSDRPIEPGEPVIIDMGATVDGYHADLTRTICAGAPSPKLAEVYAVVVAANDAARATAGPGVRGQDVNAAARAVVEAGGYGDGWTHGVGHGIGIRVHELPSSGPTSEDVLRPGHVTTIEPGIYLPDWGGVRIEDVGVVTEGGFETVTAAPKMSIPPRD